jgi:superoxide dismutase, Fe-Mn family
MFGPGFVWLVQTREPQSSETKYRILTTYLAGSPLPEAHWREQPVDMNTQSTASLGGILPPGQQEYMKKQREIQNTVGSIGMYSAAGRGVPSLPPRAPGGAHLTPLLCINTWEHVWLRDYSIVGKKDFLEAWWDRIDWEVVESLADLRFTDTNRFMYEYANSSFSRAPGR